MLFLNDLRPQIDHWESLIDNKGDILPGMLSGVSSHFTLDNNDLRQETPYQFSYVSTILSSEYPVKFNKITAEYLYF